MSKKIDKIVASFTKTVGALRSEALRLNTVADNARALSREAAVQAESADDASDRADRIANNLEGLL